MQFKAVVVEVAKYMAAIKEKDFGGADQPIDIVDFETRLRQCFKIVKVYLFFSGQVLKACGKKAGYNKTYQRKGKEYAPAVFHKAKNKTSFPTFATMPENRLLIKIINQSGNALPQYATSGSSGMDIRAWLEQPLTLAPLERALVPTGLFLEIPENYEAQVRPRSGLAIKQGITCLNTPGTIDADYRGELKVILINLSNEPQTIGSGDRIAQLVFQQIEKVEWVEVEELSTTERGGGGFGHSGNF
jgi:dUTP pyrophosphatase